MAKDEKELVMEMGRNVYVNDIGEEMLYKISICTFMKNE